MAQVRASPEMEPQILEAMHYKQTEMGVFSRFPEHVRFLTVPLTVLGSMCPSLVGNLTDVPSTKVGFKFCNLNIPLEVRYGQFQVERLLIDVQKAVRNGSVKLDQVKTGMSDLSYILEQYVLNHLRKCFF